MVLVYILGILLVISFLLAYRSMHKVQVFKENQDSHASSKSQKTGRIIFKDGSVEHQSSSSSSS